MKKAAIYFLAVYLILVGILTLTGVSFDYQFIVVGVIQLVAGVLLLLAGKGLRTFHYLGNILLAVLLILGGLIRLTAFDLPARSVILGILMLIAGILLPIGMKTGKFSQHLGTILLSAWLILKGLMLLISLSFAGALLVNGGLAIAAGVLIVMGKR